MTTKVTMPRWYPVYCAYRDGKPVSREGGYSQAHEMAKRVKGVVVRHDYVYHGSEQIEDWTQKEGKE